MITPTVKPTKGFIDPDPALPWYLPKSESEEKVSGLNRHQPDRTQLELIPPTL